MHAHYTTYSHSACELQISYSHALVLSTDHTGTSIVDHVPTIHSILNALQDLDDEKVLATLRRYLTDLNQESVLSLKLISKSVPANLRRLASLLIWLSNVRGYKIVDISPVEDPESNEILFIGIYIDNCGWEEWRALSKLVKKQLIDEGFDDIAQRVAIICTKALQTRRD